MTLKRLALLSWIFLLAFATRAQQTPSPAPVRDSQAIAVVQQSLATMGGAATLGQVQNSVVTGTSANQAAQQAATQSFTWTYAGNQFRLESSATSGSHVLVSSGGSPQDFHDGGWFIVSPVVTRTTLPYHIPALALFGEIQNSGYSFVFVGSTTLNGKIVIHIQTRDDSDQIGHLFTPQDWYFDPVTGLPLRVEFQMPRSQDPNDSWHASMDFSNFQNVNGVLIPFQLAVIEGPVSLVSTVTSATFNTNVTSTGFAAGSVQ